MRNIGRMLNDLVRFPLLPARPGVYSWQLLAAV